MDVNSPAARDVSSSFGDIGSYISIAILAFLGVSVFFAIIFGLKRGFSKSFLRLLTIAASAVGAFILSANTGSIIASWINEQGVAEILKSSEGTFGTFIDDPAVYDLIESFDPEIAALVVSLVVSVFIAPIAFIITFYVFKLISLLIFWLLSAMLGLNRKHKGFASRLLGMILAIAQGAIIVGVVALPIAGYTSLADDAIENIINTTDDEDTIATLEDFRENVLKDILQNPVISLINDFGGKDLYKTLTSVKQDDDTFSGYDEFIVLFDIYSEISSVSSWDNPTEDDRAAIERLAEKVADDHLTATVVSGILRGFSNAIEDEIVIINMEEPLGSFFKSMINVFSTSSEENLRDDLETVTHVYSILGKYNVLGSFSDSDALRNALLTKHTNGEEEKTVVDYVVDELYKNPRTAPVVNALTEISIKVMCESMGLDENAEKIYEDVKGGVKDVLAKNESDYATREEYIEDISKDLDATLKESNIEVDEATLNNMSEYIADNYGNVDESQLTDEDINRAILSYYNAYAEANPDFNPDDYIPEGSN